MSVASVVIPAHNEAATIGRNLRALRSGAWGRELEVVVVCNGCTDDTAVVARQADPRARVLEIPEPSKQTAVAVGNTASDVFPRIHLDADIELSTRAARNLVETILSSPDVHAVAPARHVPMDGCSRWVRWYYDVWRELPQVRRGLFGRGVVALSAEGQARVSGLPRVLNDDLMISEEFGREERRVIGSAIAVVRPPRTVRDLLARRVRIATGNRQADAVHARGGGSITRPLVLLELGLDRPSLLLKLPVFLAVTLAARLGARRALRAGDLTTWRRDESSRKEAA